MLVTSIFFFSHSVFYSSNINFNFWVTMILSSANALNLVKAKILSFDEELNDPIYIFHFSHSLDPILKNGFIVPCPKQYFRSVCQHFFFFFFIGIHVLILFLLHVAVNIMNCLTLSQTTNFKLSQTERVCRRQFHIQWKWKEVLQTGRKHCGKRRNCSSQAISSSHMGFSKDLYCRHVKTRACLGKV